MIGVIRVLLHDLFGLGLNFGQLGLEDQPKLNRNEEEFFSTLFCLLDSFRPAISSMRLSS